MPMQMLDFPPGGAWSPVLDRSVSTFPQFWLEPVANLLEDAVEASGNSVPVMPRQMLDFPPGGARMPVVGRSVMTFPQF
jgi:hypothetical protein